MCFSVGPMAVPVHSSGGKKTKNYGATQSTDASTEVGLRSRDSELRKLRRIAKKDYQAHANL